VRPIISAWLVLLLVGCTVPNPGYELADQGLIPDQRAGGEPRSEESAPPVPTSDAMPGTPDLAQPDSGCTSGSCKAPHAKGTCIQGRCMDLTCDEGWGDCNGSMADGCETNLLEDPEHCGKCSRHCSAGPNASATCSGGDCGRTCVPPYQDCNGDPKDGCEIPVGVPNSCGLSGLTDFQSAAGATPGCGTAYCGSGDFGWATGNVSFGSWHCVFCSHCEQFADGFAWCIASQGTFSAQRCTNCCKVGDPTYPAVCQN